MKTLEALSKHWQAEIANNLAQAAETHNIVPPAPVTAPSDDAVDTTLVTFLSQLAIATNLQLPDFIRLVRGQTADDPRPNKDLYEIPTPPSAELQETCYRWNEVVRHGVIPEWLPHRPIRQSVRPPNHTTLSTYLPQVWRHIRKGQKDGRYLVLHASLADKWGEVFISPLGVVAKSGGDGHDVRLINDYSFPDKAAVNDYTDRSHFPEITYNPPGHIANRIFTLRRDHPNVRILMMLGDVAGAFRHVPINANHAHMFAFIVGEFLVIDMSCGFGWCGSPAWYYLPGALIKELYETFETAEASNRRRRGSFWCDDHTCIEIDTGNQCFVGNIALRRAMATVLGPTAINERKFTAWSERGRALGLDWNTITGTVTIPTEKIAKAKARITEILRSGKVTKTSVLSLLGSLRHIVTCCPPARAFYQRLQDVAILPGRYGHRKLPASAIDDLNWFRLILQHENRFNSIPVEQFARCARPTVHVHMDASNQGLCVIEPTLRQYIRVRYTPEERETFTADFTSTSINVRELQSAVLAALLWGPVWTANATQVPVHVCFWIDNASAVSWAQRRASRQPMAQLYNRLLSLAEFNYSIVCTAEHIPGAENIMADAGSRAWSREDQLFDTWTNLSFGWKQVPVVTPYDNLSRLWEHAVADTTSTKYTQYWQQWAQFSRFMKWHPWIKGDTEETTSKLGMFAIFCWRYGWKGQGNQYETLRLKLYPPDKQL
ncbi:Hypothetical protein PHPALM_18590, partial [Phytophthora palmivora]